MMLIFFFPPKRKNKHHYRAGEEGRRVVRAPRNLRGEGSRFFGLEKHFGSCESLVFGDVSTSTYGTPHPSTHLSDFLHQKR